MENTFAIVNGCGGNVLMNHTKLRIRRRKKRGRRRRRRRRGRRRRGRRRSTTLRFSLASYRAMEANTGSMSCRARLSSRHLTRILWPCSSIGSSARLLGEIKDNKANISSNKK